MRHHRPESGGAISIHAPREGGDYQAGPVVPQYRHFNPRPPRGGRRQIDAPCASARCISIHAPREGGDGASPPTAPGAGDFNPRPPRGGRHHTEKRGAPGGHHFNPRPPRGGRRDVTSKEEKEKLISIHAPREGGDATPTGQAQRSPISIHAPREGGDWYSYPVEIDPRTISIHAPREGGDVRLWLLCLLLWAFQSTPPARGATRLDHRYSFRTWYFNPRPPRGGRLLFFLL